MEDQDRRSSLEVLHDKDNWVVWKTKDNEWTHELQQVVFHQILSLVKKKYWVKSPTSSPSGTQNTIKNTQMTPHQNYGKDSYTIDLTGPEETYWSGTESGLLGVFHF